ncbi:MAG TPA: hypothetical protein VFZ51_06205 [Woeseiaceae bacterium]
MNRDSHYSHASWPAESPIRPHGFLPIYREGKANVCPGCGAGQWFIGRITAECAFCGTALPLQHTGFEGMDIGSVYWDSDVFRPGWHVGPQRHSLEYEAAHWEL